jgi:hypothetical protein
MMHEYEAQLFRWRTEAMDAQKSSAEIVAEFVLTSAARLHDTGWLGSQVSPVTTGEGRLLSRLETLSLPLNEKGRQRLARVDSFAQLLSHFQLKSVREDSVLGLKGWLEGKYHLELWLTQPTPAEMLDLQTQGRRVITLYLDPADQDRKIGRHAGAYGFCLHDLEHAEKFFGGETDGQIRFFRHLKIGVASGHFAHLIDDPQFSGEFDYLMSDMNSHPVHLMKYLKAIVIGLFERRSERATELFQTWCERLFEIWDLNQDVTEAALRLNFPSREREEDRVRLAAYFQGVL